MTAADLLPDALRKRQATAAARLALRGGVLVVGQGDDGAIEFIVTWRHLTKCFPTIDALETWLELFDRKAGG